MLTVSMYIQGVDYYKEYRSSTVGRILKVGDIKDTVYV